MDICYQTSFTFTNHNHQSGRWGGGDVDICYQTSFTFTNHNHQSGCLALETKQRDGPVGKAGLELQTL